MTTQELIEKLEAANNTDCAYEWHELIADSMPAIIEKLKRLEEQENEIRACRISDSEFNERLQEATYYTWLDDQNAALKKRLELCERQLEVARKGLQYYEQLLPDSAYIAIPSNYKSNNTAEHTLSEMDRIEKEGK